MPLIMSDELLHYGTKRHSGRYPWGSGDNPYQHAGTWYSRVKQLKDSGMSEIDIANEYGITTSELRMAYSIAKDVARTEKVVQAKKLRESGMSLKAIAAEMGYDNDSSVRSLLNEDISSRQGSAKATKELIEKCIHEKGMIDVGSGVERELGITKDKLNTAVYMLECEGYSVLGASVPQATNPGKNTILKVVGPAGLEAKDIYNYDDIHSINEYTSHDNGESFTQSYRYPESMDSKRLSICYAEEGGINKDGVIEIRRGVKDLDLGDSQYAQVRILVDGDRYLKGMAVYADDLPDGVDIRFNTNKTLGTDMRDVLKDANKNLKKDPNNPFGALIKQNGQSEWEDENGEKHLSLINKTREEGEWSQWSDRLPSQFLAKQSKELVDRQLNLTIADVKSQYDDICSLTNPTLKKKYLLDFAESCDKDAEDLAAVPLPGQKYKVILPATTLKDNEVYCPTLENGTEVALIRYPHGGTFEIPILTVNNKNEESINRIGTDAVDAICIPHSAATRLSGADFDGDTVQIIPTKTPSGKVITNVISTPMLDEWGLKDFDPSVTYAKHEGMKVMNNTQIEMGKITNLITDMTLLGAPSEDIVKATKHSMVVIDAAKHEYDYKKSEIDNDIKRLRNEYQGYDLPDGTHKGGASTIISRAKNEKDVLKRVGTPHIDPETGKYIYNEKEETYQVQRKNKTTGEWENVYNKDGTPKMATRMQKSTQMKETDDAYSLVSRFRNPKELSYAEYANSLKSMANEARKEYMATADILVNPTAKQTYANEVNSLLSKVNTSEMNAPRERKAQIIVSSKVKAIKQENPDIDSKSLGKIKQQALVEARKKVGAARIEIDISDKEWEAIQSGAVSSTVQKKIFKYADADKLRDRAMPKSNSLQLSTAKQNKISMMRSSGYTIAEIANSLGISTSTVEKYM